MPVTPRTLSVYGGAGGRGTCISSSSSGVLYSSPKGFNPVDAVDVTADEKAAMQNLNSRLASYITTVRTLETANSVLDKKIREWCESHTHSPSDHSHYLATIKDLKEQFNLAYKDNAMTMLAVDSTRLAAEDFKIKYESELRMNTSIVADVAGLRKILDSLILERSDLELKYEGHKEDIAFLKKNHKENFDFARDNAGGTLDISVEAELQNSIKHLREMECEYQKLDIDLRFQHKMRIVDADRLEECNAKNWAQLNNLQGYVTNLEDNLSLIHSQCAKNKQDYDELLDIKTQLEQEIAEYRRIQDQVIGKESDKHNTVTKPTVDASVVDNDKKAEPTLDGSAVENDKKIEPTVDASAVKSSEKVDGREKNNKSG